MHTLTDALCVDVHDSGQCGQWSAGTGLFSAIWGFDTALHDPERRRDLLAPHCGAGTDLCPLTCLDMSCAELARLKIRSLFIQIQYILAKIWAAVSKLFLGTDFAVCFIHHVVACPCPQCVQRHVHFPASPDFPLIDWQTVIKNMFTPLRLCRKASLRDLVPFPVFLSPRIPAIITWW